ncbi:hypothetical protein F5882DRAFT_294626 [Hyaloscypha sp. PMI_1271]|nr:hypothetical protein F5882DRAFT_294626 [Hyaloscypha sp. PMI_1271]
MLSSQITSFQMTTAALHSPRRVSAILLRQAGSLPRRCRPQQQTRAFRLGLWSSYLDQNFQKEVRRRHRVVKHKYIEALNRRLSWDRHFPANPKHLGLKGFMCSAWRGQDSRPGGRWVDVDELFDSKERTQKATGKGIEDVEQSAVERLFKNQDTVYDYIRTKSSRLWTWNDPTSAENPTVVGATYTSPSSVYDLEAFRKRFQSKPDSNASSEPEYEIDPITNRKVFKNKSNDSTEPGRKPIEIPVKTFKGYRSQFKDKPSPSSSKSVPGNTQEGKDNKFPPSDLFHNNSTSSKVYDPAQGFEEYDRKVDYKSGQFYDPASIKTSHLDPVQKGLRDYDDKISSKGAESTKSAAPRPEMSGNIDPVQEGLREYDSKVDYGSGRFYKCAEKDIDYSDPDQSGLKEYDEKISGRETISSSLDARISKPVEKDGRNEYDNQVDYKSGQFYEPSRTTIDYSDPIQRGLKDYDGKISRQGLQNGSSIEPSKPLDPVTEAFREYDEEFPARQTSKKLDERNAQLDPVEEAFHGYDPVHEELKKYESEVSSERDPELLRASDVRAASGIVKKPKNGTDSDKLAMRKQLESDFNDRQGNTLSSADEIAAAEKVKQSRKLVEDLRIEHSELQNHAAHARSRVNAKLAEVEAGWPSPKKMTGNFVRDFPEEFETSWTVDQSNPGSLTPKKKSNNSNFEQEIENNVQRDEHAYVSGMAPNETSSNSSGAVRIEPSLDRTNVRQIEKGTSKLDNHEAKVIGAPESSSREEQQHDKTKKESDRNLIQEVRKIYEDTYGTIDSRHRQSGVSNGTEEAMAIEQTAATAEPTLYKILAYDPTMQSISTAETTSIVPDSSGALTPAEVLLRLSNPAKFFPHFQPLQSEGYEIVSGSGDVLVFRKVRPGALAVASERAQSYKATNPIDGMQSSPVAATGNFASPTGFVNHDIPGVSDPPFKSNIDVRREEPVFSGKRNWEDETEGSRREDGGKFKKVLIGGAWVAAASYAVGVVAEFFKTGGADGKGPEGF